MFRLEARSGGDQGEGARRHCAATAPGWPRHTRLRRLSPVFRALSLLPPSVFRTVRSFSTNITAIGVMRQQSFARKDVYLHGPLFFERFRCSVLERGGLGPKAKRLGASVRHLQTNSKGVGTLRASWAWQSNRLRDGSVLGAKIQAFSSVMRSSLSVYLRRRRKRAALTAGGEPKTGCASIVDTKSSRS